MAAPIENKENKIDLSWIEYPKISRLDHVDEYCGLKVEDPYHWLEDNKSDVVTDWLTAQEKISDRLFEQLEPDYQAFLELAITKLPSGGMKELPIERGEKQFFVDRLPENAPFRPHL